MLASFGNKAFSSGGEYGKATSGTVTRRIGARSAAILLDTKGPEIRTADVKSPFLVAQGDELILTTEQVPYEHSKKLSVNYDSFLDDVEVGQKILIDNGLIGLQVEKKPNKMCTAKFSTMARFHRVGI